MFINKAFWEKLSQIVFKREITSWRPRLFGLSPSRLVCRCGGGEAGFWRGFFTCGVRQDDFCPRDHTALGAFSTRPLFMLPQAVGAWEMTAAFFGCLVNLVYLKTCFWQISSDVDEESGTEERALRRSLAPPPPPSVLVKPRAATLSCYPSGSTDFQLFLPTKLDLSFCLYKSSSGTGSRKDHVHNYTTHLFF